MLTLASEAGGRGERPSISKWSSRLGKREADPNDAAVDDIAIYLDETVVIFYNLANNSQAQPCAIGPGRVKRCENLFQQFLRYSWSLIANLQTDSPLVVVIDFMAGDQWTVHTGYHAELGYAGGMRIVLDDTFDNGIRFEGENGWVFCSRIKDQVTASDPRVLATTLADDAKRWMPSQDHYSNWLRGVLDRRDPIAPVDQGACTLNACVATWIGMKLKRKLTWDPMSERFIGDDEANALCARKARSGDYDIAAILKRAGI